MMRIVFKQIRLLTRILSSMRIFKNFIARNIVLHETCCSLSNLLHEDSMKTTNNILRNHQASKKKLSYPNLFAKNSPLIFCNTSLLSPFHRSDVVYMLSKPFEINPATADPRQKHSTLSNPEEKGCEKQSIHFGISLNHNDPALINPSPHWTILHDQQQQTLPYPLLLKKKNSNDKIPKKPWTWGKGGDTRGKELKESNMAKMAKTRLSRVQGGKKGGKSFEREGRKAATETWFGLFIGQKG